MSIFWVIIFCIGFTIISLFIMKKCIHDEIRDYKEDLRQRRTHLLRLTFQFHEELSDESKVHYTNHKKEVKGLHQLELEIEIINALMRYMSIRD